MRKRTRPSSETEQMPKRTLRPRRHENAELMEMEVVEIKALESYGTMIRATLLPTPQTSTSRWSRDKGSIDLGNDDVALFNGSFNTSDIDLELSDYEDGPVKQRSLSLSLARMPSKDDHKLTTSWPRKNHSNSKGDFKPFDRSFLEDDYLINCSPENHSLARSINLRLNRALEVDFPYMRGIKRLREGKIENLFDKNLWNFLLKLSENYSPDDRQGRTEIAFGAWTNLLRFYGTIEGKKARGGLELLERLAVGCVVLQAKLLEEGEMDLVKLGKLLKNRKTRMRLYGTAGVIKSSASTKLIGKDQIETTERRISRVLKWKLSVPSPQTILFLCLDVLGTRIKIPSSLKMMVGKALEVLIERFFLQDKLKEIFISCNKTDKTDGLGALVVGILEWVLVDFFSAFQSSEKIKNLKKLITEIIPIRPINFNCKNVKEIEEAIEIVVNGS